MICNNNDINHLSIEEIEKLLEKKRSDHINRRELIFRGAKIIGGLTLGTYMATRTDNAFGNINWEDSKPESVKTDAKNIDTGVRSTVVQVQDTKSVDSSGNGLDGSVHDMITKGIIQLSGETDKVREWRTGAKNGQTVGIKVNCIAGPGLSTQVPVVMSIVDGLKLAGVLERDIIIWERSDHELKRVGYPVSKTTDSLRCYGTGKNYEDKMNNINGTKFKLSKILTDEIDVLINVPIMKNHGSSGVTLSLKNHYGSHHNPGDHHSNNCDPFIADICSHEIIRSKTKLIVVDALRAQCNGGPSRNTKWQWHPGMVLMSRDPVAIDTIGASVINKRREEIQLRSITNSCKHLVTAAGLGLGNNNLQKIEVKNLVVN